MKQEKDIELRNNTFMKFTEKELRILHYGIYRLIEDYESSSKKELDEYEDLLAKVDTYLDEVNEPIDEERLNTLAYEAVMSKETQDILKKCLYEPTEKHIQYYVDTPRIFQEGYIAGYRKAKEE